jgi:hypothetical protein
MSSFVTPRSKLETYNFVSTSTPCIPAALRLSSNKSFCHGKALVLRIDWPKQTEQCPEWQKNMSDYDQKKLLTSSRFIRTGKSPEKNNNTILMK